MKPLEKPPDTPEGDDSKVEGPDEVAEIVAVVDLEDTRELDEEDADDDG